MNNIPETAIFQRIIKLAVGGVFLALLSACGLKGDLYLPENTAALSNTSHSATTASTSK